MIFYGIILINKNIEGEIIMRHIHLLLKDGILDDVNKIKDFCKKEEIEFIFKYQKADTYSLSSYNENEEVLRLYYFDIKGKTAHYNRLKEIMGEKLLTTGYTDICNIADQDDVFEEQLNDILMQLKHAEAMQSKCNRILLSFLMPIKDIKLLNALQDYSFYMTDFQKAMLRDRIDIISGNRKKIDEEFIIHSLSLHNDVKKLRKEANMSVQEFCDYFKIPCRKLEDWEDKRTICENYVYDLMRYKLIQDNKIEE